MKTYLTIKKRKNNRIIFEKTQLSQSWTLHFFHLWYILLGFNSNTLAAINDIDAVARNLGIETDGAPNLYLGGGSGGVLQPSPYEMAGVVNPSMNRTPFFDGEIVGIVIGTDNTAAAPDDDALGTRIVHGDGAGEMWYGGTEVHPPVFVNPNGTMIIRRYFTNDSGGDITVEECGIYSPGLQSSHTHYIYCIARDVTGGIVVADTEILEVTYTVQITV